MTSEPRRFISLCLAVMIGAGTGCDCNCDEPDPVDSGNYVIVTPASGDPEPGDEWVIGGELTVDREAKQATIRYTRDGTTYEVQYTLVDPG